MFSRLKGALDSLEESARTTRQQLTSPPPGIPQRQPSLNSNSSSRPRTRSQNPQSAAGLKEKDPGEFDQDFDASSRPGTPAQGLKVDDGEGRGRERGGLERSLSSSRMGEKDGEKTTAAAAELPTEVKVKLRKLEKMETKYSELLRSYRITHAKAQLIEPFEKVLREMTACTSISDPTGFTEYLNNLSLRSDMTMEEYKRVSSELSTTKTQLAEQTKLATERAEEVEKLKTRIGELEKEAKVPVAITISGAQTEEEIVAENSKLPKSPTPSTLSISELKPTPDKSVDFFSFEDEQENLATTVATQEEQIETLKRELEGVKAAEKAAEEAAEIFQKNVEASQMEVEGVRETMGAKDAEIRRLVEKSDELEKEVERMKVEVGEKGAGGASGEELEKVKKELEDLVKEHETMKTALSEAETSKADLETKLETVQKEKTKLEPQLESLRTEKTDLQTQLDTLEKNHTTVISTHEAKAKELEAEKTTHATKVEELEEKIQELEGEMLMFKNVADDLTATRDLKAKADKMIKDLEAAKSDLEQRVEKLKKEKAAAEEKVSKVQDRLLDAEKRANVHTQKPTVVVEKANGSAEVPKPADAPLTANQKKNKKKKNKKKGAANGNADSLKPDEDHDDDAVSEGGQDQEHETVEKSIPAAIETAAPSSTELIITDLRSELTTLRKELEDNEKLIANLKAKAATADDLKEEIETLRESLLEVGEESVSSKDKMQDLLKEKKALEAAKLSVETELKELQSQHDALKATQAGEIQQAQTAMKAIQDELKELKTSSSKVSESAEKMRKDLETEFEAHKTSSAAASTEVMDKHVALEKEFANLKETMTSLQSDLNIAQQLAATRFKDLSEHRALLEKQTPELTNLRAEVTKFNAAKIETDKKLVELKRLERVERDLKYEIDTLKKKISERDMELEDIRQKSRTELRAEVTRRTKAEETLALAKKELRVSEDDRREAKEAADATSREFARTQDELSALRPKHAALELKLNKLISERDGFKEEIELKTAQHSSAQSLMQSLRDQTNELAMQMKELKEKAESQEDELIESAKLLSERSREAETMRRLLSDVETRQETRTREMKERMEQAIDERDKAEEEAATVGKRRSREIDELKDKLRDMEKNLKIVTEERDEAEKIRKEGKDRQDKAEQLMKSQLKDLEETNKAMLSMRDTMDATERQIGDVDKERSELRRRVEKSESSYDALKRKYRHLEDELRAEKTAKTKAADVVRERPPMSPVRSSASSSTMREDGMGEKELEYVKNIILQTLEAKDKKIQLGMLPVLSQILRFDKKDEQRWMSVVASIK